MRYMLDTSICIYAILGGSEHLDRRLDRCETGDLVMSAVTLGELEVGFAKSGTPDLARSDAAAILSEVGVMPFDEDAARAFGRIQAAAPSRRGAWDRQIAAHAISLGVALVTNNEKDFDGIPEVVVENWTSAARRLNRRAGAADPDNRRPPCAAARNRPAGDRHHPGSHRHCGRCHKWLFQCSVHRRDVIAASGCSIDLPGNPLSVLTKRLRRMRSTRSNT